MNRFRQPGAVTMLVTILVTCLILFLFQKILWLVVPGLLVIHLIIFGLLWQELAKARGKSQFRLGQTASRLSE